MKRYSKEKSLLPQNNILGLDNSSPYFLVRNPGAGKCGSNT